MTTMLVRPLQSLVPVRGSSDALFICASSFERRCVGVIERLRGQVPSYGAERVLLLRYSDRGDSRIKARVRDYEPFLREGLSRIGKGGLVEEEALEPFETMVPYGVFYNTFSVLSAGSAVVIDVSTIPKMHVLLLLHAAKRCGKISSLRLLYTRARYGRFDTLSWGAEEPMVLPYFGQPRLAATESSLVLFCGLEPERSYSVWRRFGKAKSFFVYIDSGAGDLDRCAERAKRLHAFDPRGEEVILPAFDPSRVSAWLDDLHKESIAEDRYLYVAPLASKWEVAAVWRFFETRTVAGSIVYASPGRLNASGHTLDDLGEVLLSEVWGPEVGAVN